MDNGNLHFNLIIRAMLVLEEHATTQAGGGIVVDSTPLPMNSMKTKLRHKPF